MHALHLVEGTHHDLAHEVERVGVLADGEVWKARRRAIVPALHRKYVASMVDMFGECALHGSAFLQRSADAGTSVEMENFFSRMALDIIGKAVFNYEFDSLTHDDPVIKVRGLPHT